MSLKKATWNNSVLAESADTIPLEGNYYFPPHSVRRELLTPSATPYTCPWKGVCSYYTITVDGTELPDGAWSYQNPSEAAHTIKGYIAFDPRVQVQ